MDDQLDVGALMAKAIKEARRELPKVNVLIAGRTGVGKSTLINRVFRSNLATTGQGRPVTKSTRKITKKGVPLAVWDTRGLEMADFQDTRAELMLLVKKRAASHKAKRHIHVAWLCIAEDGRRVEDAEIELCSDLAEQMPVLGLITKARSDAGFRAEVQRLLPEATAVVRVRATAEELDGGHSLPPMGLRDLVDATQELLPEAFQRAFVAAQKVSLEKKEQQARNVVMVAAGAAIAAGAVPIPFADAALLIPIQIGMFAKVSAAFGFDPTKDFLRVLVATVAGSGAATLAGRAIVTNILKFIPGAGTIAAGVISGATAATLTTTLGETYIAALKAAYTDADGDTPKEEAVVKAFGDRLRPH